MLTHFLESISLVGIPRHGCSVNNLCSSLKTIAWRMALNNGHYLADIWCSCRYEARSCACRLPLLVSLRYLLVCSTFR